MRDTLEYILQAGTKAPSGDNCQPWRFKILDDLSVEIYNDTASDQSLYSYEQRPSLIAIGACIENMVIAASEKGLQASVQLFPGNFDGRKIAKINFANTDIPSDPLAEYITQRVTNRKPYKKTKLSDPEREAIFSVHADEGVIIGLIEDEKAISELGVVASINERVLFEDKDMHEFFFNHVTWTEEEDKTKSIGFYIKSLEIPAPIVPVVKLARKWSTIQKLNKIGLSKAIAFGNSKTYGSAGAIGVLTVSDTAPENFVTAGRVFQRLWLTVTQQGLSLQPLTGIVFLHEGIQHNFIKNLSPTHIRIVEEGYRKIVQAFKPKDKTIVLMFRIGHGQKPSARSSRLKPTILS